MYLPVVVEQDNRRERAYDIFSRLLRERIVFVAGPITDTNTNIIIAQLLYLESDDPKKDIKMYINSPGGSAYEGLAIYDTIQQLRPDVQTIAIGTVASAATLLLAAGTKEKRMALPNTVIHMHQPLGQTKGQATDIEIDAQEIVRIKKLFAEKLAQHTGKTVKKITQDFDRDFYLTAKQAQKYGIIDEVL
ncbi:MAG: ATP-dependent Clp protease proteolytic subunit [Patescibacteria group bacterium]